MRKKNIIFGVIGFALAVVTGGQAFAALGPGEISMGVFSIPLPGCAPEVTISDEKDANDCYTMTIQNKTLQNGVCSSSGINPIPKKVCDGKDGAGGGDGIIDDVQGVYVPYPQSKGTCSGGICQHPDRQGYLTTTVSFTDSARQPVVTISLDPCEVFYDETDDNKPKKKCTAQGDATSWPNSDNSGHYEANESYIFEISDPATTADSGVDPNPYYEYVEPTKNASGWFENPGHTVKVTVFVNGQQKREFHAVDRCDKYKNSSDPSAEAVVKCTVGEPGKTPGYTPGTTTYCLNINPNLCGEYNLLVDDGACAGAGDDASRTVRSTTTEYYGPSGNSSSTSRNVGYVATTQVMCSNDSDDDITATHNDPCTPAPNPTVTCASGYTWQTCTNQTNTSQTYTGCFPSNLGQLFAYKDEIVPVSLAADNDYLYYCKVSDCNVASCWVNGTVGGTPYYNDGNGCWGRVSVQGLHGENGESCFVMKDGTDWKKCCSPSYAGNDCSVIIDQDVINKLNGMMCQVNYTHKYLHDDGEGGFTANTTKDGARGERVIVTNSCNDSTENLDTYYGEDATIEEYEGWPKIIYFAPQKSGSKLVKPGYTRVEHKYMRDGGATTMDSAQTVDSPCITVSKQTRTASGNTVTTQKQTVQKCQIQSYGELSFDSTGTWPTGNWYCLNTDASGSCDGYSDSISDEITSTLKYHLPIMKGNSGNDAVTPIAPGWTYNEEKDGENVTVRNTERNKDECKTLLTRTNSGSSTVTASVTRCTVGAPTGTPGLNSTYAAGAPYCLNYANGTCPGGLIDVGSAIDDAAENDPCASVADNATLAAKTVKKTEYEYIAKGAIGNNAGVGYVKKTKIMCDDTSSVPHEEDEYIYDTCVPQAQASGCNGTSDKNYKCYKQNEAYNSASREYDACNPSESAVALSSAVANKLDSDVTFTTGTYDNKDYILMSATGIANKPVVPVDTLKPQSLFEIWKDQYKDKTETECQLLFGDNKKCGASNNNLTASDMLNSFTAYGVWKEDVVQKASDPNELTQDELSISAYQNSLKPCERFNISEDAGYDGSQGAGKRYTMTCVE